MEHLKNCIDACLACLVTCEKCIPDCIKSGNQECIRLCRDCADICTLVAKFDARGADYGQELHAICAKICRACAIECEKHANHHESCKECAEACRKCAAICEELASVRA